MCSPDETDDDLLKAIRRRHIPTRMTDRNLERDFGAGHRTYVQAIGLWNPIVPAVVDPVVEEGEVNGDARRPPEQHWRMSRSATWRYEEWGGELNAYLGDHYDLWPVEAAERFRQRSRRAFDPGSYYEEGFGYARVDVDWKVESWKWVLLTCYQQLYDQLRGYIESVGVVPAPARWKRYLRLFFRSEFKARAEFEAKVTRLALEAVVKLSLPVAVANDILSQYGIPPLR